MPFETWIILTSIKKEIFNTFNYAKMQTEFLMDTSEYFLRIIAFISYIGGFRANENL